MNELLDRVDEHARLEEELGQTGEAVNYPLAGPKERREVRVQYSNPRNTPPTRAINTIFIKSQEAILEEIKGEEYFRWPPQLNSNPASRRTDVHCAYHRTNGHTTKECRHLKSHLEELAEAGHLKKYQEKRAAGREQTEGGDEVLGVIEVIHGTVNEEEYTNKGVRAQMRNLSLQHRVQSIQGTTRKRVRGQMETRDHIEFSDRDLDGVSLPHKDPLVVTLQIDKYEVKRVMIDPGSNSEILYLPSLQKLQIPERELAPVRGPLVGFGGHLTPPVGKITLPVIVQGLKVETDFIVVDAPSPYNVILGTGWLHAMKAVPSTLHQKLKFPTTQGIAVLRGDQMMARECTIAAVRRQQARDSSSKEVPEAETERKIVK